MEGKQTFLWEGVGVLWGVAGGKTGSFMGGDRGIMGCCERENRQFHGRGKENYGALWEGKQAIYRGRWEGKHAFL